jgi:hypothetical protein
MKYIFAGDSRALKEFAAYPELKVQAWLNLHG